MVLLENRYFILLSILYFILGIYILFIMNHDITSKFLLFFFLVYIFNIFKEEIKRRNQ